MKVLVTGAHGFLGSYIAERLVTGGDEVVALVSPWGDIENLGTARELARIEVLRADLSQQGDLAWTLEGVDAIVHAAARAADWGPWDAFYRTNVLGTQRLLDAAARAGTRRFVLISSVAVHTYRGFRDADPRTLPRDNTSNPYAYSKILAENLVMTRADVEGVVVRPGLWPFGARDATFQRVERAVARGVMPMLKRGESVLNTTYATNFADGVALAVHSPVAAGRVYLFADRGAPSWRDLFAELARLVGSEPPKLSVPRRPARAIATGVEATWRALFPATEPPMTRYRAGLMAHDVHFSIHHAVQELGYEPRVEWREGLRLALEALRAGSR